MRNSCRKQIAQHLERESISFSRPNLVLDLKTSTLTQTLQRCSKIERQMYISFATFHQHLAIFSRPFRTYINIASILHLREEACRIIPFAVIGYMQQESSRRMASRRLGMGAHFQGAHIPWWGRLRYQIARSPSRAKSKRRARLNSINTHVVVSCVGADAVCLSMRSLDRGD